jgi:acetyl esterase/lipase
MVAAVDEQILSALAASSDPPKDVRADIEQIDIGAAVFAVTPPAVNGTDQRVCIDLHGGAMFLRGGQLCRAAGIDTARNIGLRTWAIDYRMPPDHPYPAGLDDCLTAYRALLGLCRADQIVVSGSSAGANLAAAMILRARDEGLPLPAAAVLLTPHLDLTESGDTFRTNKGIDTVLPSSLMPVSLLYADGSDLADPYLSPLFGDFSRGFPPPPPCWPAARGTCCCPTPCGCTARYATQACPPNCTSSKPHSTGSCPEHPKARAWPETCGRSSTRTARRKGHELARSPDKGS